MERTDSLASVVWEEILVVQLFDGLTKFYFVNWRSGMVFAVSPQDVSSFRISHTKLSKSMIRKNKSTRIHNLCRLGTTKFAFIEYDYQAWPQRYTLFVYSLDPQGNATTIPDHLATFNFPAMSLKTAPLTAIHSSFPPTPSNHHHIIQERPNFTSHTSGIIQIRMVLTRAAHPFGFQVFVSPGVLLRARKEQDGRPSIHAWDEWGPPNTRWIKDPGKFTPTIRPYGYRIGFVDRILDFNPCEVGRDICHGGSVNLNNLAPRTPEGKPCGLLRPLPLHVESPKSRIVREPTIISSSEVTRRDIVSSLPYRETLCALENMSQTTLSYVDEDLYFVEVCPRPCSIIFHLPDYCLRSFTEMGPQRYTYV